MKHPDSQDYTVGIVGCGAMGQGIAQVSVQGGMKTMLFDAREGGADAAKNAIAGRINRLIEKGRVTEDAAQAAIDLLTPVATLDGLAPSDCVVEAAFEDLDVKHTIFKDLEGVVRPDCILSSNTSSIPLASIARVCEHRGRVAGLHFFNPVPLMKLVEVIRAAQTSDETVTNLMALGKRMTRVPVEVKDAPGFLVNMGGRAYTTEALRIAHEGIARPEQVDAIMRDCWGFRMGPFELMDLTGIDVNYPVSQIIYDGYNQDPRLKTSANHMAMFDAGLFGRKTGQGWYAYEKGEPLDRPSPDYETEAAPATEVAIIPNQAYVELMTEGFSEEDEEFGSFTLDDDVNPEVIQEQVQRISAACAELGLTVIPDNGACPILAAPTGLDATTLAAESQMLTTLTAADPARLVCIDLEGNTSQRMTLMTAPGTDLAVRDSVAAAVIKSGRNATVIADSPGFIGPRMVAMVANLGCYIAEIGLASPQDIDTAMQLGLNYPQGSIAFAESIGPKNILTILAGLHEITGDDRYRPTMWLKRRALLSNWGDFGPDDQIGRLNWLGPEQVKKGIAEVQEGRAFCLSLPLDLPGGNVLHPARHPPQRYATTSDGLDRFLLPLEQIGPDFTDVVNDDRVMLTMQYSTQWDALAHVGSQFDADGDGHAELVFYNGWRGGEDITATPCDECGGMTGTEAKKLGVQTIAETCVQGRAVLIDLHREFGDAHVDVDFDMLSQAMTAQNVTVEQGDMVMFHTGWTGKIVEAGGDPTHEMLHGSCTALEGRDPALQTWIRDSGLVALISDNYAVERAPSRTGDGKRAMLPIHELCLFKLGIPLAEIWWLGDLAAHMATTGRNRCLLTAPPLRLPGAVGSPTTPVATM